MDAVLGLLTSAVFGAGTGGIGLILGGIGKAFTWWANEREKEAEHRRAIEMTKLQHDLRSQELEIEREITLEDAAARLRESSYRHDAEIGKTSRWVSDVRAMVRPTLTGALITLLGIIYLTVMDFAAQQEIVSAVVYMAVSSVTWWFGDRMTSRR